MTVVPGLVDADFYMTDFHNNGPHYAGMHKYMIGISLHHAILYNIKDTGPMIRCKLSKLKVKPGTYDF
jgi:hypothetical protein